MGFMNKFIAARNAAKVEAVVSTEKPTGNDLVLGMENLDILFIVSDAIASNRGMLRGNTLTRCRAGVAREDELIIYFYTDEPSDVKPTYKLFFYGKTIDELRTAVVLYLRYQNKSRMMDSMELAMAYDPVIGLEDGKNILQNKKK